MEHMLNGHDASVCMYVYIFYTLTAPILNYHGIRFLPSIYHSTATLNHFACLYVHPLGFFSLSSSLLVFCAVFHHFQILNIITVSWLSSLASFFFSIFSSSLLPGEVSNMSLPEGVWKRSHETRKSADIHLSEVSVTAPHMSHSLG